MTGCGGAQYLQFMGDTGDIVMGMPATEFKPIKENSSKEEVENYLNTLTFKDYSMIIRGKLESSNMM